MRVAWDLQAVTGPKPTGLGVAARLLQRAVAEHAPEVEILGLRPNLRNQPLRGVKDRLAWEQLRLPNAIAKHVESSSLDLLFSAALGVPLRCPVPKVAYVHDLIPLHYPRQFSGAAGWYWKDLLPQTWRSCDALVVSNATVAEDLQRFIGYPRQRIFVAPYPVNEEYARLAETLVTEIPEAPYFVVIGTLEPRKNIEQTIEALEVLTARPKYSDVKMHVIGMHNSHEMQLRLLAGRLGLSGKVVFHTDYLPTEQVVAQLLGATALISMSRYEGFGLPPLEAMSIGCPVILSDTPVHRAVYADPQRGGERVPPPFVRLDSAKALAAAMEKVLSDSEWRQSLSDAGKEYAATFTAEACAGGLVEAFHAAAG